MRKLYIVSLVAIAALIIGLAYAEQITFSTYYPAPFGVYNQMVVRTLGIGDNNNDSIINNLDAPDPTTNPNDLWVAGKVGIGTTSPKAILDLDVSTRADIDKTGFLPPRMTQDQLDTIKAAAEEGSVAYNTTTDVLNYRDGTSWKPLGGISSWDSGWFEATAGGTYTLNHDLGSRYILAQVYFARDSGGSPDLTSKAIQNRDDDAAGGRGPQIQQVNETS